MSRSSTFPGFIGDIMQPDLTDSSNTFSFYTYPKMDIDYKVKIRSFVVPEGGCPELEEILTDCVSGDKVLCWEKFSTTKEGAVIITIKYMEKKPKK